MYLYVKSCCLVLHVTVYQKVWTQSCECIVLDDLSYYDSDSKQQKVRRVSSLGTSELGLCCCPKQRSSSISGSGLRRRVKW